jgi:hypothetical protein
MNKKFEQKALEIIKEVRGENNSNVTQNMGVLYYDLTDSSQRDEFLCAIKGAKLKNTIDRMYDVLFRPTIRYSASLINEGSQASEEEKEIVQLIWDKVSEYLKESGSDFDLENY